MNKIAVIIPCYNEGTTIGNVVKEYHRIFPKEAVYVYDNNSTDNTADLAQNAGATVRHEYQQGKGNVVRRMFQEIDADCYVIVDGDDTYPAENAPAMAELVLQHKTDMVIGDRLSSTYFSENKRVFHNTGNTVVRAAINHIFHSDVKDIMTGYRAFSYRFAKTFPVTSKGFEIETEMTIHAIAMNMSMESIPVAYRDRPKGSTSKLNTIPDGIRVLHTIFNLYRNYKPLQFFSSLALLLSVIDILVFIPYIWLPFRATGLVEHFPTLFVCGFVAIAAIISFFNGMILDSLMQKERRDFEHTLMLTETLKKMQESK